MNTLQIVKRRINALCSGKGQISLEWMMIAGAVIVLAVLLINSAKKVAIDTANATEASALDARCKMQAGVLSCSAECKAAKYC